MKARFGSAIAGAVALACVTGASAANPIGPLAHRGSVPGGDPTVIATPAIVRLGRRASITVRGFLGASVEVRLAGATSRAGTPLGWKPLFRIGPVWSGNLPAPALRGIYPIELRARPGGPVVRSANWLLRVFAVGTLTRPSFATAEDVARWWVRAVHHDARVVALRRWRRPAFDRRDRRLHQLLVVAYSPVGDPRVRDRLGMFITAVRDSPNGRWRLLEATVSP
jgi:hypothetical protein